LFKSNRYAVAAGVVLVLLSLWFVTSKFRNRDTPHPKTTDEYLLKLEADRKVLEDFESGKSTDPYAVYGAIIRLGEVQDPLAEKTSLKLATHENALFREGSAQSLGFYDNDSATETLIQLLSDRETSVRQFAAKAFGQAASESRLAKVRDLLSNPKLSPQVRLGLLGSLYQLGGTGATKSWALEQIVALAAHPTQGDEATLYLVQIAPESPTTTEVLHKKLQANPSDRVTGVAIRHLSSRQDPWIRDHISRLTNHKSSIVRKAIIQSLHRNCPRERWDIMKKIVLSENDKSVIEAAIRETSLLSGDEAADFFNALEKRSLHEEALELISIAKKEIAAQPASRCPSN
jgi:HEAT repeat protein